MGQLKWDVYGLKRETKEGDIFQKADLNTSHSGDLSSGGSGGSSLRRERTGNNLPDVNDAIYM